MADNVEIQGLEFQIVNDSTKAVEGLQSLINSLNRLKTATNGGATGLSKTAKSIRELSNSLKGLNSGDASQKITRLTNALTALSRVGNVKISSSIANQLTAINTALDNLKWTDGDKLTSLANGLRPLSELGKANMTTIINQLSKLPKVIEDLEAADIDKFTQQMKDLAAAMKPFADEMQKVSNGFSAFPSKIQKLITSTDRYNGSVKKAVSGTQAWGTALKGIKISTVVYASRRIGKALAEFMYDASEWEGIMYRFGRAFGDAAQESYEWIKRLNDEMQINTQQFMQYSSIYGTMLKGYGVATEDAAKMAMNYTELTYDIWAGYNDIYKSFEDAAIAVRSAIAGEVEPIRKAGFTIVDSQLKVTAANYGIAYSSQKASEELKSYLRYLTMVDQAKAQNLIGTYSKEMTTAEGLMRTLSQQIKSLSQAFGSLLLPALVKVLPYVQAFVELIGEAISAIAALFGIELQPVDFSSGLSAGAGAAEDMADSLSDASSAAKKLKQYTLGFDELNVFSPDTGSGSGGGVGGAGGSYAGMFDIGKVWDENILKNIQSQVDKLKENLKGILATVTAIGAGLLAWKFAKGFLEALQILKNLRPKNLKFSIDFPVLGLSMFLADMKEFERYLRDFMDNGATLRNVAGMISEFAGMLGDAFIILGNLKLGGALKAVQGIGEIVLAVKDMYDNGVNWDNALTAVRGLTNIAIAVEILTGNIKAAGWTVAIQGLTTIIRELATNWDAIKQGDWSGVDKVTLIVGGLEILGGLVVALDVFSKLKGISTVGQSVTAVQTVTEVTSGLETATGALSPRLTGLAKNLGIGVVVIAEVSAAAIIAVGAIWILGKNLSAVGEAWEPVIGNAGTVATAIAVGSALLGAVGLAAYGLGTLGGTVALNIGIGTAILVELGIATGIFIAEIWAIGKGLDEIGKAWEPIIENSPTIITAIEVGTGLLIGVGAVTALLGAATIASGLGLPLAIAAGTAMLFALSGAFVALSRNLKKVANEITDNLSPALRRVNKKLPQLTEDFSDFVEFIDEFAEMLADYTSSMGDITWSSLVNSFLGLFSKSPIKKLADSIDDIYDDTKALNSNLRRANPELEDAVKLLEDYSNLMSKMQDLAAANGMVEIETGLFTNLREVGESVITGFADGLEGQAGKLTDALSSIDNLIDDSLSATIAEIHEAVTDGAQTTDSVLSQFYANSLVNLRDFSSTFGREWERLWQSLSEVVDNIWDDIGRTLRENLDSDLRAVKDTLDDIDRAYTSSAPPGRRPKPGGAYVTTRASGGFVDQGQLFVAREAGAELVGAIGRRTAVANNDQIVEGISEGVSIANDGVISAIYALIAAVEDKDMVVNIGDAEIGYAYDRYNRARGTRVSQGAFANAY